MRRTVGGSDGRTDKTLPRVGNRVRWMVFQHLLENRTPLRYGVQREAIDFVVRAPEDATVPVWLGRLVPDRLDHQAELIDAADRKAVCRVTAPQQQRVVPELDQ